MSANVQLAILPVNHFQHSVGYIPVQFLNIEAQPHISDSSLSFLSQSHTLLFSFYTGQAIAALIVRPQMKKVSIKLNTTTSSGSSSFPGNINDILLKRQ